MLGVEAEAIRVANQATAARETTTIGATAVGVSKEKTHTGK